SLLPKYRGAAPIQWSVLNGDRTTGVTSMYMAEKLDSGDIIAQVAIPIEPLETSGELYERLAVVGAKLLDATLDAIENGNAKRIPQNENKTCYAPPLTKEMSPIDWNSDFRRIINQIHGLNPWPVASADIGGNQLKIYRAEPLPSSGAPVGTASAEKNGIRVAALGGDVLITEIQAAGGKRMRASDYLRGHPLDA
ncbi:MAG: methionyl-tRNA formyltransferase, partial [Oscillospiraceae bacterium]|nr:methionyl-tRNA formyltransferase [Oscillospiraceae bacterium]